MDIGLLYLAIGIAAFGYFIGDGLKNFKNPTAKNFMDYLDDDEDEHELIKERHVHIFMGIEKSDAERLIKDFPTIPHIKINNNVYYQKEKLRHWLKEIGDKKE